jgi:hypothetical protein
MIYLLMKEGRSAQLYGKRLEATIFYEISETPASRLSHRIPIAIAGLDFYFSLSLKVCSITQYTLIA